VNRCRHQPAIGLPSQAFRVECASRLAAKMIA
jgi:hypothetical protein